MNLNLPAVTRNLLIINVLMFLATIVGEKYGVRLADIFGLHYFAASKFMFFQPITYMFMHAGIDHIFFNMFALFMFGRIIEQVWGARRFLIFYLVCGLGAGLVQEISQYIYFDITLADIQIFNIIDQFGNIETLTRPEFANTMNTVGASGAIFGILLAFGMLFPNEKLFMIPIPVPIKAKFFVVGYALLELYLGLSNNARDNVAHFAHLGGMVFAFFLIMYWRKKYRSNGGYNQ